MQRKFDDVSGGSAEISHKQQRNEFFQRRFRQCPNLKAYRREEIQGDGYICKWGYSVKAFIVSFFNMDLLYAWRTYSWGTNPSFRVDPISRMGLECRESRNLSLCKNDRMTYQVVSLHQKEKWIIIGNSSFSFKKTRLILDNCFQ